MNHVCSAQPFGSSPRDCSSLRSIRFIHVANDVSPSFFISSSNCLRNSDGNLIWYWSVFDLPFVVDIVITKPISFICCNYKVISFLLQQKKQCPVVRQTLTGHLTTHDNNSIEVAMYQYTFLIGKGKARLSEIFPMHLISIQGISHV
ncbi:conserved protein of unknown function [Xenorhabdus doucetiae]|uniref:Uncharacterized protein n=1 Tax=Xenorhabdus doucetiae TaxID=351671 RepID=A0A068QUV3_9GAMM|nr:hypothetical protein LY16_01069 [Xenorhabdus doucetiae]CDG18441.1 conserved protein of unknown function [Xenorhabdus doucetiae]